MSRKKAKPPNTDDDEYIVLCFKVLTMPVTLVPGCSKVPCSECGQLVWISPATSAQMVGKPYRIACAECVAKDDNTDSQVMAPSAAQIAEITSTDPSITPARIRQKFPKSSPSRRKASLDDLLRRTKARKRYDN